MDVQDLINVMNGASKQEAAKEYNLGNLIKDLKSYDKDLKIIIDDGTFPLAKEDREYALEDDIKKTSAYGEDYYDYNKETKTVFLSYRGYYNRLAILYSLEDQAMKVKDLLEMAIFINDKYLEGYKGGDYKMGLYTPIYIDDYGDYRGIKLIGTKIEDNKVILITRKEEENV